MNTDMLIGLVLIGLTISIVIGFLVLVILPQTIKDKYIVWFMKNTGTWYQRVGKRKIGPSTTQTQFKGERSYDIDTGKPSFRGRSLTGGYFLAYLIDIDTGQLVKFEDTKRRNPMNPKLFDSFCHDEALRQLATALEGSGINGAIVLYVIMIIVGLMGGYMLGQFLPMNSFLGR